MLLLIGCFEKLPPDTQAPPPVPRGCTLLTINDTYRIEPLADGTGGLARVRSLRTQFEARYGAVLLMHAGDFLAPFLLSRTYRGQQMVDVLGALDGDPNAFDPNLLVVFGNHEFDAGKEKDGPILDRMIGRSGYTWLGSNIQFGVVEGQSIVADEKLKDELKLACGDLSKGGRRRAHGVAHHAGARRGRDLLNSGSLRLNRDIAAGPVRRQDIEELFAYPTPLTTVRVGGATLDRILGRSVAEWSGNGHFLQVAGLAFRFDPAAGTVSGTTITGYAGVAGPDAKVLTLARLAASPVSPAVEGRICNTTRPDPCLAR